MPTSGISRLRSKRRRPHRISARTMLRARAIAATIVNAAPSRRGGERTDLIRDHGEAIGGRDRPRGAERRPERAEFLVDRADRRGARHVQQDEHEVRECREARREQPLHLLNRRHRNILLGGLRRGVAEVAEIEPERIGHTIRERREVRRYARSRGVQRAREVEAAPCAGALAVEVFVERVQRADDDLFREHAGENADGSGPVVVGDPHRAEAGRQRAADRRQYRFVGVLVADAAVGADGADQIQHDDDADDRLPGAQHEPFQALPRVDQQPAQRRHVIGRKLHDERRRRARQQEAPHDQRRHDRDGDAEQIQRKHQVLTVRRKERDREQRVHRQARAAGHVRRHQCRQHAIVFAVEGSRCHHRGHVAAEADDQRHERFAGQSDAPHQPVDDECGATHVARVFEERQEQEQARDDRNERRDEANAAADAVGEKCAEPHGQARSTHRSAAAPRRTAPCRIDRRSR